jgi:hypothetical protein
METAKKNCADLIRIGKSCRLCNKQLQKKFKHAIDFGINGNYSATNGRYFRKAVFKHLINENTVMISGIYRGENATHFYNENTKINVVCRQNLFLSGWMLSVEQINNLTIKGKL